VLYLVFIGGVIEGEADGVSGCGVEVKMPSVPSVV
jgi:hypothetical protein